MKNNGASSWGKAMAGFESKMDAIDARREAKRIHRETCEVCRGGGDCPGAFDSIEAFLAWTGAV
jgi:hypothetical protein